MTFNKLIGIVFGLLVVTLVLLWYVKDRSGTVVVSQVDSPEVHTQQRDYVDIVFLDIGQGDATYIEFPDGTQMLVDCAKDGVVLEALGRVLPFYDTSIDILLVTHDDLDHYGGCSDVLRKYDIDRIVTNGMLMKKDAQWQSFVSDMKAEQAGTLVVAGVQSMDIASTTVQFLYPDRPLDVLGRIPGIKKDTGSNNASVVIKITYGDMDALLTGDAERELEEYLLRVYPTSTFDVEIYKAGHHGSAGSSIQPFVDAISPLHTVFSAGEGNRYGHPSLRVIKRVERAGSEVWRTDTQGDIRMRVFRDKIEVVEVTK